MPFQIVLTTAELQGRPGNTRLNPTENIVSNLPEVFNGIKIAWTLDWPLHKPQYFALEGSFLLCVTCTSCRYRAGTCMLRAAVNGSISILIMSFIHAR